jgi:hypothetical protein
VIGSELNQGSAGGGAALRRVSAAMALAGSVSLFALLVVSLVLACGASAAVPWWKLNSVSTPANLPPGGTAKLNVLAYDLGNANISAAGNPAVLVERLPAGLTAKNVSSKGTGLHNTFGEGGADCLVVSGSLVECVYEHKLTPYEAFEVTIEVEVHANAKSGEETETTVSGGGAPGASLKRPMAVSGEPPRFGVEDYEFQAFNENGTLDTQAGSHPFQLTTTLNLDRTGNEPYQPAQPKDLHFALPAGLVGNPTPFPQCTDAQFLDDAEFQNFCPPDTAVGVAVVTIDAPDLFGELTAPVPLFNLKPNEGEPARFGFELLEVPVILDTSVRTGGDYGVTVSVDNIPQAVAFLGSQVTFWGVPGEASHDSSRSWGCLSIWKETEYPWPSCTPSGEETPPPLLSLPTSCTGPLQTSISPDSWQTEGDFLTGTPALFEPALDGCNRLPFSPSISVTPDGETGSTPTGLTVGIHVPQTVLLSTKGLAEANVKDTTVTLPAGVALNPSAADGLKSCSEAEVALSADVFPSCPEASKIGTVEIESPLLPNALTGSVYLASQNENPFGSLVAMYVVAQDPVSGTLVKVAGEVHLDPVTGQIVATFDNTPQLPFENLHLHFFGGDRAPLGTPAKCGGYTTGAVIAPWSGNAPAEPSSTFEIASGPNGSACSDPAPFSPSLTAGTTNIQAGGFTPFTMTVSRNDGEQNIQQFQLHMPKGLSGLLTGVELCGEAQANAGTCGPNSLIGETTVSVGLGGDPYSVTGGKVYITGPYEGAPFGVSVAVPAKAGPYDLGTVVVRGRIEVDPQSSALTVTTNSPSQGYAIPRILDGIPLQIRHVNFETTRPGFTFNPTNCNPLSVTGNVSSVEGSSSDVSVPFQVTNCAVLGFTPQFSVSTGAKTSRTEGASLHVKLAYPQAPFGSQANIARVKVELPKQLPSRLTTLQKACPDATFNQNPAACPAASKIGSARATTPLIPVPLEGPVYFVSNGGEAFPNLIVVLQGYGVTVHLVGDTFISKAGITSSTFKTVPDVPVGSFELNLPQGPYSALTGLGNLCKQKLVMPTEFVAQNGAEIHTNTKIAVTGCGKSKTVKHKTKAKHGKKLRHQHERKRGRGARKG